MMQGGRPSSRIPRNFLVYGNSGSGSIGAGRIAGLQNVSKLGGQKPLRDGSCRFDPVSAARYTRICVKRE